MSHALIQAKALIALALSGDEESEEGRTAAMMAVRLIRENDLLRDDLSRRENWLPPSDPTPAKKIRNDPPVRAAVPPKDPSTWKIEGPLTVSHRSTEKHFLILKDDGLEVWVPRDQVVTPIEFSEREAEANGMTVSFMWAKSAGLVKGENLE